MIYGVSTLYIRLLWASNKVQDLLKRIDDIEKDQKTSTPEKREQIKKIKEEITKVGTEIDNVKREFKLLNAYRVN